MNVNSEPPTSVSGSESSENVPSPDANDSSQPIYFRSFTFSPDVLIRFDYHGKGVDLSQGPSLAGLLAGLGQLNCSQLTLKRMSNRHGYKVKLVTRFFIIIVFVFSQSFRYE